jgi:hypothetical protein
MSLRSLVRIVRIGVRRSHTKNSDPSDPSGPSDDGRCAPTLILRITGFLDCPSSGILENRKQHFGNWIFFQNDVISSFWNTGRWTVQKLRNYEYLSEVYEILYKDES